MPKASRHQAVARQWEILKRLPYRGPGVTAHALADHLSWHGFVVTKRTVERDLQELSRLFPLNCNDKGAPYGWHWMEGEGLNLPGVSVADALSLHLVEDLLRPLLPAAMLAALEPRFRQASAKLDALATEHRSARWADKVRHVTPGLPLRAPAIAPSELESIQTALLENRQLELHYRPPGGEDTRSLRLHPLGLIQRGPVSYLVATAFGYADVRRYAVHRIRAATLLEDAALRAADFDLDDYIASGALQFGEGGTLRLKARLSKELAAILEETPLASDQVLVRNGGELLLTATVSDSWQLQWWILSQGDALEVLAPAELREKIGRQLREAAAYYGSSVSYGEGSDE